MPIKLVGSSIYSPVDLAPHCLGPFGIGRLDFGPLGIGNEEVFGPAGIGNVDFGPAGIGKVDFGPEGMGNVDLGPLGIGKVDFGPDGIGNEDPPLAAGKPNPFFSYFSSLSLF